MFILKFIYLKMFAFVKKSFKWSSAKSVESKNKPISFLYACFSGILEDILLWKKMWLSLSSIFFLNVFFFTCIHWDINLMELIFCICATILSIDAFETWLKYKHRTACLKRLPNSTSPELNIIICSASHWIKKKWIEFVYLRETNHAKAFLLVNIFFTMIFLLGKYMSGYVLLYLMCMAIFFAHQIASPVLMFMKIIQQHAESDVELEGLIPEVSEVDIKILSIESELPTVDDRQSLDYWKPDDMTLEDASDSSENSSSLVTNISMEKLQTCETSDSSDDEYTPLEQQKEQLQTTLEVVEPQSSWGSSAYNAVFNAAGAVANMVYTTQEQSKRKRIASIDSSDGFEIIDKNDLS